MSDNNIDDWTKASGTVTKTDEFPKLDPNKEYVLQLVEARLVRDVTREFKGKERVRDEFRTVWKVEDLPVKVWQNFTYSWNLKSNLVLFIERLEYVLREGETHQLTDFFTMNMRIRCRLDPQDAKDGESSFYNINFNTVRRYAQGPQPAQQDGPVAGGAGIDDQAIKEFIQNFANRDQAWDLLQRFKPEVADETSFLRLWDEVQAERTAMKA